MILAASLTGRKSEHRPTAATSFHSMITRAMASMKKSTILYGIGINDADYLISHSFRVNGKRVQAWRCPFYISWANMLMRCYSDTYQKKRPSYIGCSVCDEWLIFSNFKTWMETQDWEDKQLDKDLLLPNNKVYSPETCIFVDRRINSFTIDSASTRGEYLIGVCWYKTRNKFIAHCRNPFTNKSDFLGYFTNELEGHYAWKKRKHELACQIADTCNDARLAKALRQRYA